MIQRIDITGIRVEARHGVLPEERERDQPFVVDVSVFLDLSTAAVSDDLEDTVDYGELAERISGKVRAESHQLIERVAHLLADMVMEDARIQRTIITVHKPEAPVPVPFQDVAVTVERGR